MQPLKLRENESEVPEKNENEIKAPLEKKNNQSSEFYSIFFFKEDVLFFKLVAEDAISLYHGWF